jgi:hypothetical protein
MSHPQRFQTVTGMLRRDPRDWCHLEISDPESTRVTGVSEPTALEFGFPAHRILRFGYALEGTEERVHNEETKKTETNEVFSF